MDQMEPLDAARRVVAEHFPSARAVLLGSSVLGARRTATSDLDLAVVLDGPPAPYRQTLAAHGWPVEIFAHTPDSLRHYWELDARRRKPGLLRLCADGHAVVSRSGEAESVREEARQRLEAGPPPLDAEELDARRYAVSDLRDDLVGCADADEIGHIAARLLIAAGELALLAAGRWLGTGKWLHRDLAGWDAELASRLAAAHRTSVADGQPGPLVEVVDDILVRSGGRLLEGYYAAGEDPGATGEQSATNNAPSAGE